MPNHHTHPLPLHTLFPSLSRLPQSLYNTLILLLSEFLGTTFFLFFALAGLQASDGDGLYGALAVGFALAVNVWVFFRVTSGVFNPAVTLGMVVEGSMEWKRGVVIFGGQMMGGLAAGGLVEGLCRGDGDRGRGLGRGTGVVRGLFIELLLTAAFVFSVFMLATEKERHKGTLASPIGLGLALFIAQLAGGPFTGASLNPARSFGTAVAAHHFPGYHWIYWLGPLLGSLLAVGFYRVVRVLEVEMALVVHGESFLGHRRGVSNMSSQQQVDPVPTTEVHVLDPVAESDLEKGLKAPGTESAAPASTVHPNLPGKAT